MDGIRAFWNGFNLLSKAGNFLRCPPWFISGLAEDITLDGELWMGPRTSHNDVMSTIQSENGKHPWSRIGYYLFDTPSSTGTFLERMKELSVIGSRIGGHVHLVTHKECVGNSHVLEYLQSVVIAGGEGVILRNPCAHYQPGYTLHTLKVKVQYTTYRYIASIHQIHS